MNAEDRGIRLLRNGLLVLLVGSLLLGFLLLNLKGVI